MQKCITAILLLLVAASAHASDWKLGWSDEFAKTGRPDPTKWGYEKGALYGVLIVLAVVYLDFRNVRMTLLALLPLVTSKLQLFGLMGLLDIPLNPAATGCAAMSSIGSGSAAASEGCRIASTVIAS